MEKFKNIPIYPEIGEILDYSKNFAIDTYPQNYERKISDVDEVKPIISKEEFINLVRGEVVETLNKLRNGGFAYEEPTTKVRTWFGIPDISAESIESALEQRSAVIHEVIKGECRYFCDLDDKTNKLNKLDFEKLINAIQVSFGEFFVYFYRDTGKFDNKDYAVNCFRAVSNANYNSAHLIFDIIDKTTKFSYGMKCPSQQGPFWISFVAYLDKKYDLKYFSEVLDTAIYRYNTQMRVVTAASPKQENAPGYGILQPINGDYYRLKIPNETLLKIKTDLIPQASHFVNKIKHGYSFDDFLIVPHFKVPRQFLDYTNEAGINKPIFYTEYEKLRFAEILKTSTLNIDSFSDWRKAHYRIFCFYHFLPLEQRKRVVREFFASRGWDKHMNLYENDELCDEWIRKKWHHNYRIDVLEEKFKVQKPPTKDFCADEVTYPQMNPGDNKIICIRSGTKTGKSYNFIKQFKDARTLCITYRVSLAYELVRNAASQGIEYINYKEYKNNRENSPPPQHFVCQLESLFKYADIIDSYDVVFIDESEAFVGQFNHVLKQNPRALPQLQFIFELIMNEKNVIFASANLAERTTTFIKDFKKDFEFLNNTKKDKVGWSYEKMQNVPAFMKKIKELAAEGKKLIIPTNDKKSLMMEMIKILSKYGRVLTITADDKIENMDVEKWANYDFVIYTPKIEAGVNYLPQHFDHICGLFLRNKNTYDSCYQMLFRARQPVSQKMYIYAEPGKRLKRDDLETQKEIDRRIQIKENKTKKFNKRYAFNNSSFVYGKYMHPIYKAIKRHELFRNYSKTYFDSLLFKELENSGVALDGVTGNSEGYRMTKSKELREMYNDKIACKIINQEEGTAQEYGFKLDEIGFPINWQSLDLFSRLEIENKKDPEKSTVEVITDLIQKVRNYLGIINKTTHFFNKEQDIIFKLTNKIIPGQNYEPIEFEKLINEFMTENYNVWTATFEKRKCSLKDMLAKKLQYKLQSINPHLERCYFKMYRTCEKYVLNCNDNIFIHKVLEIIEKYKNEVN